MLAVGSLFSDQVEASADPNDSETVGMQCYAKAEQIFNMDRNKQSLTTVPAMGVMSTWNASRGHYTKARLYAGQSIRIAVEMGLHQENGVDEMDEDTREVRNATFWGAFMLDQ
jgi:hypothetical protein